MKIRRRLQRLRMKANLLMIKVKSDLGFHAGVSPTGRAGDCKAVLKKEGFFSPPVQLYLTHLTMVTKVTTLG